jgi:hypothetical protein
MQRPIRDLAGQRFGRWTVLSRATTTNSKIRWRVKCDCGTEADRVGYSLLAGQSQSCGCIKNPYKAAGVKHIDDVPHIICSKCKKYLPEDFFPAGNRAGGRAYRCKPCNNAKSASWRKRYPERAEKALRGFFDFISSFKQGPCADRGRRFPDCAMDFDHRNPDEKRYTVSEMRHESKELIAAEIAKCDLVCSNCHRVRTRFRATLKARPFRAGFGRVGIDFVCSSEDES